MTQHTVLHSASVGYWCVFNFFSPNKQRSSMAQSKRSYKRFLPRHFFFTPRNRVTRWSGWNGGDPSRASHVVRHRKRGFMESRRNFPICRLQLRYYGNPHIATIPLAIYMCRIEKHGGSHLGSGFTVSIKSWSKIRTQLRFPTTHGALQANISIPCSCLPICTDVRGAVTSAATMQLNTSSAN